MLNFEELFDLYQAIEYDGEKFTDSLAALIKSYDATRILDCAAGTGFPAIELHKRGIFVDCTDGSQEMIDQLSKTVKLGGIVHFDFPKQLESDWSVLGEHKVDGHVVTVIEKVTLEGGQRNWYLKFIVDGQLTEMNIYSAAIKPDEFMQIARRAGLAALNPTEIDGERDNYQVILGTRVR